MSCPPAILNKIKLLLNLATSPNPNEAENAQAMADKLIAKHNVTAEELASLDKKAFYGEDEKLFITLGIVGWKQQLALVVATFFDCQIVQEELVPGEGAHQFNYYVYGDDDQVKDTQFVYHAFAKKIEKLSDAKCMGRGPIYIDSYCEGVTESVKWNIKMYGIDMPEINKPLKKEEVVVPTNSKALTKSGTKEEPVDNRRVNVNDGSMIKDIMAYFKGVDDGKDMSLKDILSLEVKTKEAEQLKESEEKAEDNGNV
jgi:hypothetical protein